MKRKAAELSQKTLRWGIVPTSSKKWHLGWAADKDTLIATAFGRGEEAAESRLRLTVPAGFELGGDAVEWDGVRRFAATVFDTSGDGAAATPQYRFEGGTAFQCAVWAGIAAIPFGEARSYGELAAALGRPKAARAVGNACKKNPLPLVVGCHRVIPGSGKAPNAERAAKGGYMGDHMGASTEFKAILLAAEAEMSAPKVPKGGV